MGCTKDHSLKIEKTRKNWKKEETSAHQIRKRFERPRNLKKRKRKILTGRHGILEVPEETDCRGITVPVAIKIEKSRKEDLDERDIC
ncbi:conserved hypothetical protein [Trichinella spiralis]|uniref:hypothetical protein n=1 Tax=Trichinella spiralis TaxID=6334 RepID=UPI0001EFDEE2|nr:conserved hypothetical protein [Trichinella spiralis]